MTRCYKHEYSYYKYCCFCENDEPPAQGWLMWAYMMGRRIGYSRQLLMIMFDDLTPNSFITLKKWEMGVKEPQK